MTIGPAAPILGAHSLEKVPDTLISTMSTVEKSNCATSWHLMILPPTQALRLNRDDTGGVQMFVRPAAPMRLSPPVAEGPVTALDHVVVHTANVDRALAIYGAKLDLDLRLDRANEAWGARQLFFKAGEALVEVGASLKAPASNDPDRFGGLAWRVADPLAAQARMAAAGFDVSEVRTGRKPGTMVFTVRDAPGGAPTLMIQQNAEPA